MAIKSREELLDALQNIVGENRDDYVLSFIEDVTDTFNDLETKQGTPITNDEYEQKLKDQDAAWRQKYYDRFFGKGDEKPAPPASNPEPVNVEPTHYEDLFEFKE